jgi:membrane-associated phospholipid phosphatase
MRKILSLLTALFLYSIAYCTSADSVSKVKIYHVNRLVEGSIILGGGIADYFENNNIDNKSGIYNDELLFLNTKAQRDLINPFDRWVLNLTTTNRSIYQQISGYGMGVIIALPFLLTINKEIRKDWLDLLLMYTEGHTITFTYYNFSFFGPTFQNRFRPLVYYSDISTHVRESAINRNSFYSGHVASSAYSTFFMAKVYCDYHPNIGATKYLLYAAALVPPLLEGYVRVKALEHFPSDIVVGLGLGAILGILIPELHKNHFNKNLSLSMFSSSDGMGLSMLWKLPNPKFLASSR